MKVVHTASALKEVLNTLTVSDKIGFVPTMGALHEGHVSLVMNALKENTWVVVSIFVNPTQFDNPSDLAAYPRTLDDDVALLDTIEGNIVVFAPNASEIYGDTVISTTYDFGGLENEMEGKHRIGHFNGVGTVLTLLFNIIEPDNAYFGEKDFQQLQIVKKLVILENLPITIVGCPILREKDGLAMSSRNKRLTEQHRNHAAYISEVLKTTQRQFQQKSIEELTQFAKKAFADNEHLDLEYFEIADVNTLKTASQKIDGVTYRAFIAAFAGEVRLIDNMALN